MGIRSVLRLSRAHTAPLESVPAGVGALVATEGSFTTGVFSWLLFGIGYHLVGYGHNSWTDWKNGHDKSDPNKQHHPLNTGEMSPRVAGAGVLSSAVFLFLYVIFITPPEQFGEVLLLTVIGAGSAWIYNEKGKKTQYKFVFISIAHSTVFLIPYFAMGGKMNILPVLTFAGIFFWITHQILISGEMKDLQTDDVNFVKMNSLITESGYYRPTKYVSLLAFIFRMMFGLFMVTIAIALDGRPGLLIVIALLTGATIFMSREMVNTFYANREKTVRIMSLIEMVTVFIFLLSFSPVYGPTLALVAMSLSILWVVSFNKIMWNTTIKPDV